MAEFRRRWRGAAAGAAAAMALSACAGTVSNDAINEPIASVADQGGWPLGPDQFGSTVVGVAFSGGGMRASAFSYGVLSELDRYRGPDRSGAPPDDRDGRSDFGRLRRLGHGGVFRPQGPRRACPASGPAISRPQCRTGFRHRGQPRQRGAHLHRMAAPTTVRNSRAGSTTMSSAAPPMRACSRASGRWSGSPRPTSIRAFPFVFEPVTFNVLCSDLGKSACRKRWPRPQPFRASSFP